MEDLGKYMETSQLVDWVKANLDIIKLNSDMTKDDIRIAVRWIGECSYDTIYIDSDKARLGRVGIGLMLTVTLI